MKTRHFFIVFLFVFIGFQGFSQIIRTKKNDSITFWTRNNIVGFDLKEIAFVNWSAGGNNALSGLLKGNFNRDYKRGLTKWSNELIIRYGLNKQAGIETRKTDDVFQFNSTFSHQNDSISSWSHSAKFNFNTQFTNGYAYPNTALSISGPFAPAYTFLGVGAEYNNPKEKLNIYLSPLTFKNTMVLNQRLADQGAFGVKAAVNDSDGNIIQQGKRRKTEIGPLITAKYNNSIGKNITMENRLALYSDYLNKFGNIDVNWLLQIDMIVNSYVKASIGLNLIYDDDIDTKKQVGNEQIIVGPRVQLKQMLGLGLTYSFKTAY